MPFRYRFSAQLPISMGNRQGGARATPRQRRGHSPGWGKANLTRRYRSALVAALACAGLLMAALAADAKATRHGAKHSATTTAKGEGKSAGKKQANRKS